MRVENLKFVDGDPAEVTLTMSVEHAAQLVEHCGALREAEVDATSKLYDVLNQKVFLPYWDEGVLDYRSE